MEYIFLRAVGWDKQAILVHEWSSFWFVRIKNLNKKKVKPSPRGFINVFFFYKLSCRKRVYQSFINIMNENFIKELNELCIHDITWYTTLMTNAIIIIFCNTGV